MLIEELFNFEHLKYKKNIPPGVILYEYIICQK